MDIMYGGLDSHVLYGHDTIASQNHHRIVHNAGKTISQEARLVEVDPDASIYAINKIQDDVANNHGLVKFGVKMEALLAFSKIHWIPKLLAANCPDVNIQFENGTTKGTMMGPAIRCNAVAWGA
ncbi:uncharacterized protein A4U43_C03F18760 [Asparagus officinalis]|uniref:Uncharacterized protein n=1 Tax=Asparagus officinalis TaxID=4686 RepID=A0A5P1FB66_ASPOF|nr:uncharacterized protein A4U43_C03F18760 [Asparagus officinalis]